MNKKKLPRAITRAGDDTLALFVNGAADSGTDSGKLPDATGPQRLPEQMDNVIELPPSPDAAGRVEGESFPLPSSSVRVDAKRRRSVALAIVSRHAAGSALGGIIPLPLVTFAGVTAVIVRMIKALSDHYGVPFERDRARAIVVGLVGGAMPAGVAAVTTSTLLYILPPAAAVGLAASAITAVAFTRSVGRIFIEHFESGATLEDFSERVFPHS